MRTPLAGWFLVYNVFGAWMAVASARRNIAAVDPDERHQPINRLWISVNTGLAAAAAASLLLAAILGMEGVVPAQAVMGLGGVGMFMTWWLNHGTRREPYLT